MAAQTLSIPAHYAACTEKQQIVTTTAAPLTALAYGDEVQGCPANIFVQALSTNTGTITLSCNGTAVSGGKGIELAAGQNVNLPSNNKTWSVICSATTQKLNITYQSKPS